VVESGFLGTVRLQITGSRDVVLVDLLAWKTFCNELGQATTPQALTEALSCGRAETMTAFTTKFPGAVKNATTTTGMALYVPPGFITIERTAKTADVFGIRGQVVAEEQLEALEKINTWLLSSGKPNTKVQLAIDVLTLAIAD